MKSIMQELRQFAKDLTVLIVEDDKTLNQEIVDLAKLFFKETYYAYDGLEALQTYERTKIDVLITDISMPKMDGVALSKKIKSINPNQSIVVISAHRDSNYLVQLIDIGIKQLVYKPFDHQELLYRLLRVCEDTVLAVQEEQICEQTDNLKNTIPIQNVQKPHSITLGAYAKKAIYSFNDEYAADIENLVELKDALEDYVNLLVGKYPSQEHIDELANILLKIYTTLSQMPLTSGMSVVVYEIADFIQSIRFALLTPKQKSQLNMFEYIYEDISSYIDSVFIKQTSIDATYLEASLRSSLVQLKGSIMADFVVDANELELF